MNSITIELCPEDRARLDRVIRAMEIVTGLGDSVQTDAHGLVEPVADENAVIPEQGPDVPLEQIQKKVVELCAAGRKAQAREIIKAYGEKVSDLKQPAQRAAVWARLVALEVGA